MTVKKLDTPIGALYLLAKKGSIIYIGWERPQQYLEATEVSGDEASKRVLEKLSLEMVSYFEGKGRGFSCPLEPGGTEFQRKVWEVLQHIPYGETRSYKEVARAIGKPGTSRAVGNACGANPLPIVIPCHRVIRSDGSMGGYGSGSWRKAWLLRMERASLKRPFQERAV